MDAMAWFDKVLTVWNAVVFTFEGHEITVAKICVSILVLVVGILGSGRVEKALYQHLATRSQLKESSRSITAKLTYYILLVLVALTAMRVLNIPLTAFTFLGGAVAIGVGFGAQKLFNNFISGFILMAEQPIKVGDLIEIDKELGWVDDIGVRSTKIRTFANINKLVPNSYFLENNITNWTHNDNLVRCDVTVGMIYGSPVETVREKLIQSALEHPLVHKAPEPFVLFTDFGDNALIFKLFFWVTISQRVGRQLLESDIRFKIDALFREAGLVIAFPQSDVHLDTAQPLRLQLVNSEVTKGKTG